MSWLYIDTHESGVLRYAILNPYQEAELIELQGRGQQLLPAIESVLKKCEGIVCVAGPGSFSAIRNGVLDANLLARLKQIPLAGLSFIGVYETLREAERQLNEGSLTMVNYLAPVYDAEPNITFPT